MSKNRKIITSPKFKTFESIDAEIKRLAIQKSLMLDEHLSSKDVDKLVKAAEYISKIEKNDNKTGNLKTHLFSPENEFTNGLDYKPTTKSVTFDLLRKMGKTPVINSIISTRIDQICNFANFTTDIQKEGWTIRRKVSAFEQSDYKITDKDKRVIESIAKFLLEGGENNKWDINDDFEGWLSKSMRDSLTLDQSCTEFERNRGMKLVSYQAVDSAMFRFLETVDPFKRKEYENRYEDKFGYLPIYCQTHNNQVLRNPVTQEELIYYPWELSFGIRNKQTSIRQNGYGTSELEILMEIVTYLLWGLQSNGNYFKQGGNTPGFFSLKEGSVDQTMLNEFRSYYRDMMVGVQNHHKAMFLEGDVQWNPMGMSNKDMEYARWIELLTVLTCSVYKVDPSELGFRLEFQGDSFGQRGQKERLDHSKNKGLKPLLVFKAKEINKFIVSELDPNYEFIWTGIDIEDETQLLDNDVKKLNGGLVSLEDMFKKYNDRPLDKEKDTILNSVYQQAKAAAQYGGQESNQAVDQMNGEQSQNPFEQGNDMNKANPIDSAVRDYLIKAYGRE